MAAFPASPVHDDSSSSDVLLLAVNPSTIQVQIPTVQKQPLSSSVPIVVSPAPSADQPPKPKQKTLDFFLAKNSPGKQVQLHPLEIETTPVLQKLPDVNLPSGTSTNANSGDFGTTNNSAKGIVVADSDVTPMDVDSLPKPAVDSLTPQPSPTKKRKHKEKSEKKRKSKKGSESEDEESHSDREKKKKHHHHHHHKQKDEKDSEKGKHSDTQKKKKKHKSPTKENKEPIDKKDEPSTPSEQQKVLDVTVIPENLKPVCLRIYNFLIRQLLDQYNLLSLEDKKKFRSLTLTRKRRPSTGLQGTVITRFFPVVTILA